MGEWWAAAVAAAGEQPPADLPAAAAEELIALWSDLGEAIRRAAGRSWSLEDPCNVAVGVRFQLASAPAGPGPGRSSFPTVLQQVVG